MNVFLYFKALYPSAFLASEGRKSLAWLNIGYSYSSRSLEFILSAPSLFLFVLSFRWVSGFTNSGLHRRTNESLGLGSWPHSRRQSRTGRACFLLESKTGAYVRRNESKEDVAEQLRPAPREIAHKWNSKPYMERLGNLMKRPNTNTTLLFVCPNRSQFYHLTEVSVPMK